MMKQKSDSTQLVNAIFMVAILLIGTLILAFGSVKVSADETSQEAVVGENFVNTFNNNKFVKSNSSISKIQEPDFYIIISVPLSVST